MRIVQELDERVWRRYVDQNPLGNVFHTPEMYQVFARAKGYRPSLWAAVDDNGEPLALLPPVQITLVNGPMQILSSRAVVYGSVLYTVGAQGEEALAQLLTTYNRAPSNSNLFTECRNLTQLTEIQPTLSQCGFVFEGHLNFLIDLAQPEEAVWEKIQKDAQYRIRRELKRNVVEIIEADTPEHLRHCYELLRNTYENARLPLADFSLFQAIFDILCPKKMARITLAYFEGAPISTAVDLLYKEGVYGFYGGMDRQYSAHSPAEILQWHIFRKSKADGFTLYDFGGAGKPDEEYGVRDYKAKYGGELVNFGRNVCVHSPRLLSLSKRGYELYRRLLPSPAKSRQSERKQ